MKFFKNNIETIRVLFLLFVLTCRWGTTSAQPSTEFKVRAVFIYHFTKFIEWPQAAFETPSSPFIIAVVNHNPFGNFLNSTVQDEAVNGHPIIVKYVNRSDEISFAHIIYFPGDEHGDELLKRKHTLTIVESADAIRTFGIIRFLRESNKIKLQIAATRAKNAGLSISSKLLRLADIID